MGKENGASINEAIKDRTGVDADKAIVITKMLEEYALQKVERINPVEVVKANIERIEDVIKNQMIEGRHYGKIPGTEKTMLKLSGQDLLLMNFSMRPSYQVEILQLENGHREYIAKCCLYKFIDLETSLLVGEGEGSCSTLEDKYNKRWTPVNFKPSQKYWDLMKSKKYAEAKMELPPDISSRKINGSWTFCKQTENPNIADLYNTVRKMARIRAKREAVQTLFAVSEAFDFIDDDEDEKNGAEDLSGMTEVKAPASSPASDLFHDRMEIKWNPSPAETNDPEWFIDQIKKAKSKKEIKQFFEIYESDMKFFHETIYQKIKDSVNSVWNKFPE